MRKFLIILLAIVVPFGLLFVLSKKDAPEKAENCKGIELTYYKVFDDSDVIEPLIGEYERKCPGLKINYKKFSDFDEYQKTILNEMAEGEGPDIFSMQNTWFASNYRKLAPLPKDKGLVSLFESTFVDVAAKDLVIVDKNGERRIFGVPMTVDTLALFYNKDHFEDRIPEQGVPSVTWEGIKDDVVKLKKEDNSFERFEVAGIAMGTGTNISRAVDVLYTLFLQYDTHIYNEDISEAVFAGLHTGGLVGYPAREAVEFFTSFADSRQKHYAWNEFILDEFGEREIEAFAKGEVSMIFGFSHDYDAIKKQINLFKARGVRVIDVDDIHIAPMPQLFDPEVSTEKRVTLGAYFAETVSRNSEHPDIAWDFLLELIEKENLETYFKELHKPTSRRDMIEEQSKHPIYGVFAGQIGFAESFPIIDYYTYKRVFEDVINGVSSLVEAQERITGMLPLEGIVNEEVEEE